jgi:hypothetical protein
MSFKHTQDVSNAVLTSMTEDELANFRRQEGAHVVYYRGRYWEQVRPGFYQPIHLLARLSAEQATPPVPTCWGYQASLCEEDAASANGSIPIHLLSNVESYDLYSIKKNSRYDIRKSRNLFNIVALTGPTLLQEQGYEVFLSAITRTGETDVCTKKQYMKRLANYLVPNRRLVLAGLMGDKLCGYISGYAVNGTAYGDNLYITTEVIKSNLNRVLLFEFVQACRRSGEIREFFIGQHWREKPGIVEFKEGMGFPVNHIPAKVQMNSLIAQFIRWRYPHKYYRLTGQK